MQVAGEAGETVELLWAYICLDQGLLGPLLQALCRPPGSTRPVRRGCFEPIHALTLHVLAEEARAASEASPSGR